MERNYKYWQGCNTFGAFAVYCRQISVSCRFKKKKICECLEFAFQRFTQHTKNIVRIYATDYNW